MSKERQDRTDRILILVALVILFMAGGAYYFDGWMFGNSRSRGERIGAIANKNGDVRVKYEGDLKWGRAARGQELAYNDSIYAGEGGRADLSLGNSEMTVSENTLIVLRREKDVSFMNLNYGTLFGRVAKNEKIMIDTGAGKPIEFSTKSAAQIVLRKTQSGKTELNVVSGDADVVINGKKQKVDNTTKVVLDENAPTPAPKLEPARLRALKPLRQDMIYANEPTQIPFAWEWGDRHNVQPEESFTLEFSADPTFRKIHAKKQVTGRDDTTMQASKTLNLFYRIRGPRGVVSQTEKVNFVRMHAPTILKPLAQQQYFAPIGQQALVEVAFIKNPAANAVNYELAKDAEFKQVVARESIAMDRQIREIAMGEYFARARHDYGEGRFSDWSETVPFKVEPKLEPLRLADLPARNRVLIPNRAYPAELYKATAAQVKSYLTRKGFLADHFPGEFDELTVQVDGYKEPVRQRTANWPRKFNAPGTYIYKYQQAKSGFLPTPMSDSKRLEIAMEPPRALGQAQFHSPLEDGSHQVDWGFTPLLFASSYDVEVSRDSNFRRSKQIKVDEPAATARLNPGLHYWRVRARDDKGRLISDFSDTQKFDVPVMVPPSLAQNEVIERKPSATETSTMKIEEERIEPWYRHGLWLWAGTGMNYVDYRQSVERGTMSAHGARTESRYLEVGYEGLDGLGGVVSYKATPGKIVIENAPVDKQNYTWSTLGVEGMKRIVSNIPFTNIPAIFGVRVGVQQHKTPFLFLNAAESLNLRQNSMDTASLGLLAEVQRHRWTFYWLTRYQYPFSSKAEGSSQYEIKPTFAFDGSVGTSYNLSQQWKLGLFWYGQWHQYNFVYGDTEVTNAGFQSLFYSNIDFRVGFDF